MGAVLNQHDAGFVVAFASRSCNNAEKDYSAYDGRVSLWCGLFNTSATS